MREELEPIAPEQLPAPRASGAPQRTATAKAPKRPEYIVEPPDLLLVEVLEALPGRPISGERLVRPDGRISVGFYGEIPVAGLTLPQIKERIVLHLRKFINDDILGLVDIDEDGQPKRDAYGRIILRDPRDTDRVFVDVTAYNSQHDYVLGEVPYPGSLPYTGGDTVLDLLQYAGGLLPTADRSRIRLIRSFPKGSPAQVLPINYEEIAMGTDSSTNYAILPNDRLVVPPSAPSRPEAGTVRPAPTGENPAQDVGASRTSAARTSPNVEGSLYFNRRAYLPDSNPNAEVEERIVAIEKKLDQLVESTEKARPRPGAGPEDRIQGLERKLDALIKMLERNPAGPAGNPGAKRDDRVPTPLDTDREPEEGPSPLPGMTVPSLRPGPQSPGPRRPGPRQPRPSGAVRPRPARSDEASPEEHPAIPDLPEQRSPFDVSPPDVVPES